MLTRIGCAFLTALLGGCSLPSQRADFTSVDPQERTLATLRAAESGDARAIPDLIGQLESDDPAQRMLSIRTLEHLTGQTLGYGHADPEPQRREAISRWREWYRATTAEPAPSVTPPQSGASIGGAFPARLTPTRLGT